MYFDVIHHNMCFHANYINRVCKKPGLCNKNLKNLWENLPKIEEKIAKKNYGCDKFVGNFVEFCFFISFFTKKIIMVPSTPM